MPENSRHYRDEVTHIQYVPDTQFIESGMNGNIPKFKASYHVAHQFEDVRYFPDGSRNCYTVKNLAKGRKYLIRASFMYGNYDGLDELPQFDLYLGANRWDSVGFENASQVVRKEIIIALAFLDFVSVCLVNTAQGTPFISVLEVRLLDNAIYTTGQPPDKESRSLVLFDRRDLGGNTGDMEIRYAIDVFDRIWSTDSLADSEPFASSSIIKHNNEDFQPPSAVMRTAVRPVNGRDVLYFNWTAKDKETEFLVFMHFAEIEVLGRNQVREFNVCCVGCDGPYKPKFRAVITRSTEQPLSGQYRYSCSVRNTASATLPPLLNAIEIYKVRRSTVENSTQVQDVEAMMDLKAVYDIKREWVGDPCVPTNYSWNGLTCRYGDSGSPRITYLDLSGNNLTARELHKIENGSFVSDNRRFTYAEVVSMTNDFQRVIGKGGFGTVYQGHMKDGTPVAVKMLSQPSSKGSNLFWTEAHLLMRVHHRNLASFMGYCDEGPNMALVYEYMSEGNLAEHLSGKNQRFLIWEDRLRIALDAAQGLEYLHTGCKPPVVHRDVKTANILLNERLEAKIADFGLSKIFPTEGLTHMSTDVVGTTGYLDPEYYITNKLNEKSDVYGFGVVLLELITGQPAIIKDPDPIHLVQWAAPIISRGDIRNVIDPRLKEDYDINSVWKAAEIAMACIPSTSIQRLTMNDVVIELKECLAIEAARERIWSLNIEESGNKSSSSFGTVPMDAGSDSGPQPR
ncbi:hypothetical protein ACLOJK_040076 [Asimina triloba]